MGYLGTQKELGYKGNWDVWGRKYTLLGLLDCYARTGDVKDLAAAQAVADHLMRELPADGKPCIVDVGQWNGMAASSIIEPLVKLYFATGEKKYLDYAASIPASWETEGGPKLISKAMAGMPVYDMFPGPVANPQGYGDYGKSKSYEMMSCYDGLIELYRAAGKAEYLEPVKTVGSKEAAPAQCDMHQNCCVANGPRGMLMIPKLAVMRGREGPVVNLYGTMQATVQSPGGQDLKWEMYSDYPIGGAVTLKLNVKQPE
jgi:DUF1680 family protein